MNTKNNNYQPNFLQKRYRDIGVRAEVIELVLIIAAVFGLALAVTVFATPGSFVAKNNQYIVGPIVNCALIIAGVNFRGYIKTVGVVCLPSIGALIGGLLLSSGSVYMLYMIPAIWLGNVAIMLGFKFFFVHKKQKFAIAAAVSIAIKVALIFGGYNLLVAFGAIPAGSQVAATLWTAMGVTQLLTATIGAVAAFAIVKTVYSKKPVQI